jgi:hypothetical protein
MPNWLSRSLGPFADAPKIGHVRDLPDSIGYIRITPFSDHIRLMLGRVIERQLSQQRVIADADCCVDAGRLQYVSLDEFGHFVSRVFPEKLLGTGDIDKTLVDRIDVMIVFVRILLVDSC